MGRRLSEENIERIISMIDGWTGTLTWSDLQDRIEVTLHHRYTRQALNSHGRIKLAFNTKKRLLRKGSVERQTLSAELRMALERIERQDTIIERQKEEINNLTEKFVRWAYNASAVHGIHEDVLERSLPPIDRERTKEKRTKGKKARK